ncbi:MAG: hypothetical protein ASARMPRED_000008 [Alectoria sarmentosa]|nr:MAG: hypothetical protein ASARMPRED_000008 [Alectoria sarmentosa]
MQLSHLLASLLASGEVVAYHKNARNVNFTDTAPSISAFIPITISSPPPANITLTAGTVVDIAEHSCWTVPVVPPVASNSSKYAKGICNVCVSQSLRDVLDTVTTGTLQDYRVQIRDDTNHDMGAVNGTLAALGGETGDKETNITMTVGGKPFHLWTMRDPGWPLYPIVYMDYDGPGPADPFVQPPMVFDAAPSNEMVANVACTQSEHPLDESDLVFAESMEAVNPRRDQVIRVTVACGVLATVAVCLRFVARWRSKASFAADDWWMVASLIPLYCMLAVGSIMITSGGGGRHADTLTQSQMAMFLKTLNAAVLTYTLAIAMVKISILLLYRRIFDTRIFRRATTIVGMACISWLLAALLCLAFQCHTNAERDNPDSLFSDQCIHIKVYWDAITGSNMGLDLIILCMPLHMVWNLKLATRQKIALSGIFALGASVCAAGLMRIITIDLVKGGDLTYTIVTCYMWSQVEPTMAIVCACFTTLRPLFAGVDFNFLSALRWTSRRTASSSSSSAQSKGRRLPDPREEGSESDEKRQENNRMDRSPERHHKSDIELVEFEQVLDAGTREAIGSAERAESERRWNYWREDGASTSVRARIEESFV